MAKIFEVQYWFTCPEAECLKKTLNTITVTADYPEDARELALAGLICEHCQKELPEGYFVSVSIKQVG